MIRRIASFLLIVLCPLTAYVLADSTIAGKWNCLSTDEKGMEVAWTLIITDDGGKLSGSIIIGQTGDKIDILEPVLNGNNLTFKIQINPEETVELTGRITGSSIDGTFKGKASGTGTFKGSRQAE